jgi:hypothetical protein
LDHREIFNENSLGQLKLTSFQNVVMFILIRGDIVNSLGHHEIADQNRLGQLKLTVRFSKCCYAYFDLRVHSQQLGSTEVD